MKTYITLISLFIFLCSGYSQANTVEDEFKKINAELNQAADDLSNSYKKNEEEALYTFNIDKKIEPLQAKQDSFVKKHPEYKSKFMPAIARINDVIDLINSRHEKELKEISAPKTNEENHEDCRMVYDVFYKAIDSYRDTDGPSNSQIGQMLKAANSVSDKHPDCEKKILRLQGEMRDAMQAKMASIKSTESKKSSDTAGKNDYQNVSYDEWFTLQNTGIKSGKKYSFIACVNGTRNVTASKCNLSGSAAKRVFYNTDDIKDIDTKKKWVNTINENKCVTAYVTGHEAFVVDMKSQNECK